MEPTISVVMPVFNCAEYVGQAIESILAQSFTDFELIIVDDGSTDDTIYQVKRYADPRISICGVEYKKLSFGATAALNIGISKVKGEFIARQDGDDYSLPTRFERQAEYLYKNPMCKAVGTGIILANVSGRAYDTVQHLGHVTKYDLVNLWPCVAHPTIMMRAHVFNNVGSYDETIDYCEDYDLWMRITEHYGDGSIHNLPEIQYVKREHDKTNTAKGKRNGLISLYNEMVLLKSKIRRKKNEI